MLTLLLFAGVALVLAFEGRLIILFLGFPRIARTGRHSVAPLQTSEFSSAAMWALGFPVGAFLNVLVFFLYTLLDIPLAFRFVLPMHAVMIASLFLLTRRLCADVPVQRDISAQRVVLERPCHSNVSVVQRCLIVVLALSIAVKLFYGGTHAVVLPTYYYDSLSQWTMRARVSYEDKAIAFDADERRGISKPQYPILLHALQIFFMLPQGRWDDAVANGATLILTLSSFLALFLLLQRMRGTMFATVALWTLLGIPLGSMHLAQGFGDIHVLEYLLLSAVLLVLSVEDRSRESFDSAQDRRLLWLSAIFVAAVAWVKIEGLVFGVVPWLAIAVCGKLVRSIRAQNGTERARQKVDLTSFSPLLLSIPWFLLLLAKGLPLGPHGTAFSVEWHPEAVVPALKALFASGSFGIHWYVVLGLGLWLGLGWKTWRRHCLEIPMIVWGFITFVGTLFIYFFTPNVQFLINAQTFSRTMLIPMSLLLLGFMLALRRERKLLH